MVARIVIESVVMVFGITIAGFFIGKLFKEAEKEDQEGTKMLASITMTQGWMIGIIALMVVFGVCALIFAQMGKKNK